MSAIQGEYEFTLPVCGKKLFWKPLSVQKALDIPAANRHPESQHLIGTSLLIARIVKFENQPGAPAMSEWGSWDEFDLEAFGEEVSKVEEARKAMFRKERMGSQPRAALRKQMEDAHALMTRLSAALKHLDEAITAEELASPLK